MILYVDFEKKCLIDKKQHELVIDPVLLEVKKELSPDHFKIYKKTVDDWMRRNFEYEMSLLEKKD